jgi:hypothetical protein
VLGLFDRVPFNVVFLFRTPASRGKTKAANPSGRRFAIHPAEILIQRVSSLHIVGNFHSRSKGIAPQQIPFWMKG